MKGFSLLEIIIAVIIGAVAIIALFELAFQNTATADIIRHRLIATQLAQEGIEIVTNIRLSNFIKYGGILNPDLNPDGTLKKWRGETSPQCLPGDQDCLVDGNTYIAQYNSILLTVDASNPKLYVYKNVPIYCYGTIGLCNGPLFTPSPYRRQIAISTVNDHQMSVTSTVSWVYNGKPYSVSIEDRLYNYL